MSNNYTFKVKKGKFELEVFSDNKYFVMAQYDKLSTALTKQQAKPKNTEKIEKTEEKAVKKDLSEKEPDNAAETIKEAEPVKAVEKQKVTEAVAKVETTAIEENKPVEITETTVKADSVKEKVIEEVKEAVKEPIEAEKDEEQPETEEHPSEQPEEETDKEPVQTEKPQEEEFRPDKEVDEFLYKKNFEPPKKQEEKKEEPEQIESVKASSVATEEKQDFAEIMKQKMEAEPEEEEKTEESQEEEFAEEADSDPDEEEVAETLRKSFAEADETEADSTETQEPVEKKSKVYDILEEKLADLPEEDRNRLNLNKKEVAQDSSTFKFKGLEDLIYLKKPQTKLDYLLIAAYYLQEKEDIEKYSLKQVNSTIMPHIKEPVDHSVIHEAVGHEYLEVVPDYLGSGGVTEYKITKEGIEYILNEL